jgi:hypothetical protein
LDILPLDFNISQDSDPQTVHFIFYFLKFE